MIDIFDLSNCLQIISEPIHTSGNALDLIFKNKPELCLVGVDGNSFKSDHYHFSHTYQLIVVHQIRL